MLNKVEFGKQLKALRAYHNINQKQAGEIIGVRQLAYFRRENGHIDFTLTELYSLAVYFDKTIKIDESGIFLS